jgi:hypothetical protein
MSLSDALFAGDRQAAQNRTTLPPTRFRQNQGHFAPSEDLSEFLWLRDETKAAMYTSCDREMVRKLYNTLQEIETCIQNLQRAESL